MDYCNLYKGHPVRHSDTFCIWRNTFGRCLLRCVHRSPGHSPAHSTIRSSRTFPWDTKMEPLELNNAYATLGRERLEVTAWHYVWVHPPSEVGKNLGRIPPRSRLWDHNRRKYRVLSIRPKIPEIPGGEANGTDIFRNFIPKFWKNRNNRKILFHSAIPARA